jgi:hypothetical protein
MEVGGSKSVVFCGRSTYKVFMCFGDSLPLLESLLKALFPTVISIAFGFQTQKCLLYI